MRQALVDQIGRAVGHAAEKKVPDHVGLAYGAWAPVLKNGKVPDGNDKDTWLAATATIPVSDDYKAAFARWKSSFQQSDYIAEFTLASRLLVGHGNASPTEVGLTIHHTWGVPIIPGSALKGLLAHYVEATYGPTDAETGPADQQGGENERASYRGVTWDGNRIKHGPGDVYRAMFGAPDAEDDNAMRQRGLLFGASRGLVTFHDALYAPESVPNDTPFAIDVLTVHQKSYYDKADKPSEQPWPCDYDDPNPVAFLSVRPPARFLLALSGPRDWTELAGALLSDALTHWGVGGKTSTGYGRGKVGEWKVPDLPPSPILRELKDWLDRQQELIKTGATQRSVLEALKEEFGDRLLSLRGSNRASARQAIGKVIKSKSVIEVRDQFLAHIWPVA